jgi:hypothetical protein
MAGCALFGALIGAAFFDVVVVSDSMVDTIAFHF